MHFSERRLAIALVGTFLLLGLWYAFRPEKLFINHRVDEAAPDSISGDPKLLNTASLTGDLHTAPKNSA